MSGPKLTRQAEQPAEDPGRLEPLKIAQLRELERRFCRPCERPRRWQSFHTGRIGPEDAATAPLFLYAQLLTEMCDAYRSQHKNKVFRSVFEGYKPNTVTRMTKGAARLNTLDHVWAILHTILFGSSTPRYSGKASLTNEAALGLRVIQFFKHRSYDQRTSLSASHYFHPSLQACRHPSCYAEATALYVRMLDKLEHYGRERERLQAGEGHVYLISGYEPFSAGRELADEAAGDGDTTFRYSDPGAVFQHSIAECVNAGMNLTFITRDGTKAKTSARLATRAITRLAAELAGKTTASSARMRGSINIHTLPEQVDELSSNPGAAAATAEEQLLPRARRASEYLGGLFRYALYIWPPDNRAQTGIHDAADEENKTTLLVLRALTDEDHMLRVFDPIPVEAEDCLHWARCALATSAQ